MQSRTARGALLATIAAAAIAPASAQAAQITITGDAGSPVALNPAAPTALRNTDTTVTVNKDVGEQSLRILTKDPSGAIAGSEDGGYCWSINGVNDYPKYHGNGTYTVAVTAYSGASCAGTAKLVQAQYTISAGVTMAGLPGRVLTRPPNSSVTTRYELPIGLNPGIGTYEVRYANGAVMAPDGSISGPSTEAFVDTTRSVVSASFDRPGTYTFVAHGSADGYFTPWSAPVQVTAVSPFDFAAVNGLRFPDSRGPRYKLSAHLRERSATGRVYISYARGSKGGKYRSLGSSRISGAGTISKRFTLRKTGTYRLRFRFKGSATTAAGEIKTKIRITRRVVF
jgi:hypothetical protein